MTFIVGFFIGIGTGMGVFPCPTKSVTILLLRCIHNLSVYVSFDCQAQQPFCLVFYLIWILNEDKQSV
jgi:hypothetical protein